MIITQDKETIFYILLVLSLLLIRIPYIGIYFRVLNTLVHENGHILAGLLTNSTVKKVELFADTSGTTITISKSKISQFFVSIAGYIFSSLIAYLFFRLIKYEHYNIVLYSLTLLCIINLLFFVRNKYGMIWLILFTGLLITLLYFANDLIKYGFTILFASIILTDSIASAFVLLKLSFTDKNKAGDATNLKKITYIPAFFWALLFFILAIYVLYKIIVLYIPVINDYINSYL